MTRKSPSPAALQSSSPGSLDPAFASIETLSGALAKGELSSEELASIFLARIARLDGKLHAYVIADPEQVLRRARAADADRAAGRRAGALLGMPVAIKDIFDCAGYATQAGSRAMTDRIPSGSAHAVSRLEAAGMIVLGKTQMVEFAFGGWGTNPVMGAPWNPWDLATHRVAGGSSSGSAVAVAAGLAPAALGSDTGGSIRTPAAWCGVIGLKSSVGLVGRHGVVPLCPTHDSIGPLTRTVRDAALLLDVLAGEDPFDPETWRAPTVAALADIERGIEGMRIGILRESDLDGVDDDIRRLLEAALTELEKLGARLEEVSLPLSMEDYVRAGGDIMSAESYAHLGRYAEPPDSPVDPVIRERILRGRDISAARYILLLDARRRARAGFQAAMGSLDALIVPSSPRAAIPLAEVDESVAPNIFGRFVNFLDLASLSVPIGLTDARLPAGMQIVTRRFHDALALRIGRAFERARGGLVARPTGV